MGVDNTDIVWISRTTLQWLYTKALAGDDKGVARILRRELESRKIFSTPPTLRERIIFWLINLLGGI